MLTQAPRVSLQVFRGEIKVVMDNILFDGISLIDQSRCQALPMAVLAGFKV